MPDVKIKKSDGGWLSLRGPQGVAGPQGSQGIQGAKGDTGPKTPVSVSLGCYLILTNVGSAYDAIAVAKGLGIASIDFTGCTQIEFSVNVNKVGTGTQSWQLWDVTGGSELTVINDSAAAADNKILTASKNSGLPTGVKTVRVRVKSTVAADDPVYYGASVRVTY